MASIHSEFHRFLAHLAQREVHDDLRRLANLVFNHLQPLAEVGTARRGRSTRLTPLAIAHLAQMPAVYDEQVNGPEAGPALGRLHQLYVGPFRGFMRQETFDLSHDITLIYGANGTGKSSFCEALEVAMLGSISEAQVKRVDQRIYCNNARLRRHDVPVLSAGGADEAQAVQPNETEYRFCFIEKNRLDDFARIAARTPSDQRQLIATLFGVEQFSEFVRGFNPSLDQDLMLVGVQASQLAQRRLQLANSEQTIASYPQKIAAIEGLESGLAQRMSPGAMYLVCVDWLLGTPQQQGRLPHVQAQLDAVPPAIHEVTQAKLQAFLAEAYRVHGLWQASSGQLAARAGEVSYAKLYEAVLALADGANACPACGTGLAAVAQDPFARARLGLEQLAQLAVLQQQEAGFRTQLSDAVRVLWEEMRRVITVAANACPAELQAANLPALLPADTGNWLGAWVDGERRAWNALLQIAERIEGLDAKAREVHAQRGALAQERDRLNQHQLEIERLRTMRTTADQELAAAHQTVAQFDEANRELIQAVAAEVPLVAHHERIKAAYDGFLPEIQAYLAALPGVLLQGLGEQARNLYNAFNRADLPGDLLNALWLPVAENGKIEVEFVGEPGVRYDALIVFSEGHIKCLGLAILLAKNIAQGCPVVIFDDVVNAIDDEHRDGIWRTFFEDGLLEGKQIILTSHAEEFLLRIQQELGARRAAAIKRYRFLPHEGEHELRVDSDPPTKNYVLLAQQALAADEKREALRQARPALESLTDRLWTWMGRRGDGRIDIKLGGPRSLWELNNKCTKLRSAVDRIAAQYAGAPDAVAALVRLLNVNGASIEWGYLNSGVHDAQRDHEFDRATVRTVVESVSALDAALDVMQNR
ncbi:MULTISPECIES: AAA family ATPase [Gammaproteobacteria]|uniref:AAA family ATPase n=1 Tax=Gammaproteobacteria TaxID=1236 RepID=UPI0004A8053A|nr:MULTISPECIES: AAA family ATPase [Gammaproteobacteria]AZU17724.1 ATPase [Xanthomonas citri pv. fuscans]AZU21768.1 ATPase [Xanthomonas citri pv. fuscans]AZU92987.1 ATPase [Xanthomonas citri pv. fuscans]KHS36170.1 ATPase [Xanthomonas phaseoli pv. phaseoli]POR69942.1 ATPase [Pseudomonas syringae pv. syringae]